MIAHVVLFQPRQGISAEQRREFVSSLKNALNQIPEIRQARLGRTIDFSVLPTSSLSDRTYEYAAVFEFDSPESLRRYLDHEAHQQVRTLFWSHCEATIIADIRLIEPAGWESELLGDDKGAPPTR